MTDKEKNTPVKPIEPQGEVDSLDVTPTPRPSPRVDPEPSGDSTEASLQYRVHENIVDRYDPDSPVEYTIEILGPQGEIYDTIRVTQNLSSTNDNTKDTLGREAVESLVESPNFERIKKNAKHPPKELSLSPVLEQLAKVEKKILPPKDVNLSPIEERLRLMEEAVAAQMVVVEEAQQQTQAEIAHVLEVLTSRLAMMEASFSDMTNTQREVVDWLHALHSALTT